MADLLKTVPVWKLMNDYNFVPDSDTVNDDMLCLICKNLMIDACHSVCGCQYCRKCITEYIGHKNKFCPGNKLKCKEEYLSLTTDVMSDARMNNKIFKSKVLCPNDSCKVKIELINIQGHLEECCKRTTECPYASIGCDNKEQTKDSISVHLDNDTLPHIHLLFDYIHNLKNEVDVMKSEIFSMKESLRMKDLNIEVMTELRGEMNDRILNLMNKVESMEENSKLKERKIAETKEEMTSFKLGMNEEITNLKKEIEFIKENSEKQMSHLALQMDKANEEMTHVKKEIESVKKECIQKESGITTLEEQLRELKIEMELRLSAMMEERAKMNRETEEQINEKIEALHKEINDQMNEHRKEMESLKVVKSERGIFNEKETRMNDSIKSCPDIDRELRMHDSIKLCPNIDTDFIWKIDGWTKKKKDIHSESFYSKNYKLCLRLSTVGNDIWLWCVIMRGDMDDNVRWPMRHRVTLSIINRDTLKAHKSITLKYDTYGYNMRAFDRPTNDMNYFGIGTNELINCLSIKDNRSINVNDSIVVSCILTYP